MTKQTTVDKQEVEKFSNHATQWWEKDGPLKTLHDINPTRLQFIEKHVTLKGLRVLDVGCGGGILSEGLAQHGAEVIGLDVEPDAIVTARAHAHDSALNISYCCQPIETYLAPAFDCITCLEMLEHVADPRLVIEHCARLLKPGGYLFLSTLNRSIKAYATAVVVAEYILSLLPRQTHDYKKFIKPSELSAAVRSTGLSVIDIQGMSYDPFARTAALCNDVSVNYLMLARSPNE